MSLDHPPVGSSGQVQVAIDAPPGWRQIDFISDLHLAPEMPETFTAWQDYLLGTPADAVFILGDLFEAWVGDDSRHFGFEAKATAALTRSAAMKVVFFMVGNRDFLLGDAMLRACGVQALADPAALSAFGSRALLTHGDAWCTGDLDYQGFRAQVRAPAWQAQVLERPLEERRSLARSMRSESERLASGPGADRGFDSQAPWHDIDPATAQRAMIDAGASVLVHGHTHRPGSDAVYPGGMRHVLSDWDLDCATRPRAEVLRWDSRGWRRLSPSTAVGAILRG